jgi:hypothetical protein
MIESDKGALISCTLHLYIYIDLSSHRICCILHLGDVLFIYIQTLSWSLSINYENIMTYSGGSLVFLSNDRLGRGTSGAVVVLKQLF